MNPSGRLPIRVVIAISFAWSLLLMSLFAPGLAITDSVTRCITASHFAYGTAVSEWARSNWFPPGMALAMSASLRVTDSLTPYLFFTCWWFFASAGMLLSHLLPRPWAIAAFLLILIYPPFWNHAVSLMPDAPVAAAINTLVWWMLQTRRRTTATDASADASSSRLSAGLLAGLFTLACVVMLTYRSNCVTLLPVVVGGAWWASRHWKRALPYILIVCLSLSYAISLPNVLLLSKQNTVAASLVWEHIGMLALNRDPEVEREFTIAPWCSDASLSPDVANSLAKQKHTWYSHDGLVWSGTPINIHRVTEPGSNYAALHRSLVIRHPSLYFRMKWEIMKTMLGLRQRVPLAFIFEWVPPELIQYNINIAQSGIFASHGKSLNDFIIRHGMPTMHFLTLPWPPILIASLLASVACFRRRFSTERSLLLLAALSYYGGFMLVTPGFHYRYFLPAHVLLIVFIVASLHGVTRRVAIQTTSTSAVSSPLATP